MSLISSTFCDRQRASCLLKAPQAGQGTVPQIRPPQQNVVNNGTSAKVALVSVDRVQHVVGKHEPRVKHHSPALLQMGVHQARAEKMAHGHDQHGPFLRAQILTSDLQEPEPQTSRVR